MHVTSPQRAVDLRTQQASYALHSHRMKGINVKVGLHLLGKLIK